jgi:hypothetical protein
MGPSPICDDRLAPLDHGRGSRTIRRGPASAPAGGHDRRAGHAALAMRLAGSPTRS